VSQKSFANARRVMTSDSTSSDDKPLVPIVVTSNAAVTITSTSTAPTTTITTTTTARAAAVPKRPFVVRHVPIDNDDPECLVLTVRVRAVIVRDVFESMCISRTWWRACAASARCVAWARLICARTDLGLLSTDVL
jgi:hypothetical protein